MSPVSPWRLFHSGLTGRYYLTRAYKDRGNGVFEVTGVKYDVTDQIDGLVGGLPIPELLKVWHAADHLDANHEMEKHSPEGEALNKAVGAVIAILKERDSA